MSRPINRTKFVMGGEEGLKSEEREADWAEHIRRKEYDGATTKGVIEDFTVVTDTSATIKITAILNAKNAFGVVQKSLFTASANVDCGGLTRIVIKKK